MRRNFHKLFLILCCVVLVLPSIQAISSTIDFDQVVVNSNEWEDIYQGILFAKLVGVPGDFVLNSAQALNVAKSLPDDKTKVLLLETKSQEQYKNFDSLLEEEGFEVVTLDGSGSIGTRLWESMDADSVIITDKRYPYNAISLAPYALLTNSFVLFSDENGLENIDDLADNTKITIYGLVDSQIIEAFPSAKVIDEGGKFDNNIYIVNEFRKEKPVQQVDVTNGEFFEVGLMSDKYPIVFLGSNHVPEQVERFFADTNVSIGVLVGNNLVELTTNFKNSMKQKYDKDIYFYVRFGRSPRIIKDKFNEPSALEYFSLPLINPQLNLVSVVYNRLSQSLEVTVSNPSEIPVFFSGTFTLEINGQTITVGDEDAQVIVAGQEKTLIYDVGIDSRDISGQGFILFGDYPSSLEFQILVNQSSFDVVEILDTAELDILSIVYDKYNKAFFIEITNPGKTTTFGNIELIDVIIDGVPTTVGTKKPFSLAPGETKKVFVRADLSDLDIVENDVVTVKGIYGQRENVLFKELEKDLDLKVKNGPVVYIIVGASVLIIILILLFFLQKKLYECEKCSHQKKSRLKPGRHTCGGVYRKKK